MTSRGTSDQPRTSWVPGAPLVDRGGLSGDAPAPFSQVPVIGVLALQGDVLEHLRALNRCGAHAIEVRTVEQLAAVQGLVVPGGESTTIGRLLERFDLMEPLRARIRAGMPVFGTCAGMILLSDELDQDTPQPLLGGLAVKTRRNAFGRQRDSFDASIAIDGIEGPPLDVAFIRAPFVVDILSDEVVVRASVNDRPVVVEQGSLLASAFHPELTGDDRLHAHFVRLVRGSSEVGR